MTEDLNWIDVLQTVPWFTNLPVTMYWYFSPNTVTTFSESEMRSRGVEYLKFRLSFGQKHDTLEKVVCDWVLVSNTNMMYRPIIKFSNVRIDRLNRFKYQSVGVTGTTGEDYLKNMIDYDPLRVDFFKNPIDKINFITLMEAT